MSDTTHKPKQHLHSQEKMSMHEDIATWCDCCVCEAEPYWAEVAEDMGINMSDYEDSQTSSANK